MRVLIATSNQGKLRDFAGAAAVHGIEIVGLPGFARLPVVVEDGATFEENARKKAEHYSRYAPGELVEIADRERGARFVCVISAARDGQEVAHFHGEARGTILRQLRGELGFGYDPLFYMRELGKSFAELTPEEKALVSHRGAALRKFLEWARVRM